MCSIIVLGFAFLSVTGIFFLYEKFIILNPFMDPIAPHVIWGMMFGLATIWYIRIIQASSKK